MLHASSFDHDARVSWKSVRLELARSPEFPRGSASRAFLLRLPLCNDGWIDCEAINLNESQATVRRFWASEPDSLGKIVRSDGEWSLRFGSDTSAGFRMPDDKLVVDQAISIQGPDGVELPFRVISIAPLGRLPSHAS